MKLYSTVCRETSAEQTIEKSRFIAYIKPVESKEEADMFIASVKKKHKDATHNVPAMVIGDKFQIQWASDDGEPQGTSGAPIVQMLVREGITNVAIVVTRYFGGIKLGTGGLVRAYTGSAKLGLEAAKVCDVEEQMLITYSTEYTNLARIQNMSANKGGPGTEDAIFSIQDIGYSDVVTMELACIPEKAENLLQNLANVTGGKGIVLGQELRSVKIPRECKFSVDSVS